MTRCLNNFSKENTINFYVIILANKNEKKKNAFRDQTERKDRTPGEIFTGKKSLLFSTLGRNLMLLLNPINVYKQNCLQLLLLFCIEWRYLNLSLRCWSSSLGLTFERKIWGKTLKLQKICEKFNRLSSKIVSKFLNLTVSKKVFLIFGEISAYFQLLFYYFLSLQKKEEKFYKKRNVFLK